MAARGTLLLVLLAHNALAAGTTVDASSTTFVGTQPDWRDGQTKVVVPFFERVALSLKSDEISYVQDLRLTVSGWAGADGIVAHRDTTVFTGDLDLAYVQGSVFGRHLTLTLGRQLVTGGVARLTPIDGARAEVKIWRGLGISGYWGAPAVPRFMVARGDSVIGGRVFWRQSYSTEFGFSFNQVWDHSIVGRRELGLDARYVPDPKWTLNGFAAWSLMESRLAEGELAVLYQPIPKVEVSARYRRTAPDLFISRASIFSVFAETRRDEIGGSVAWRPQRWLNTYIDANSVSTDSGGGFDGRGRVSANLRIPSTVGAELRALYVPANGYFDARLFGIQRFTPDFFITADLDAYFLKNNVNGVGHSITASASASYLFLPRWRAVLTGTAGSTPFFSGTFQVLARVVYEFSFHHQETR